MALGLAACGGSSGPAPQPAPLVQQQFLLATVLNGTLPTATVDAPYSYGFQTNQGDPGVTAAAPVSFSVLGTPPPGLSLSPEGQLTGSPTQAGFFSFDIQALDSSIPTPQTAKHFYNLQVNLPGAILTQVSHLDLGGHGQNADVRVATANATGVPYAYVGTRGTPGECPATGVKIVDLSTITHPQVVATAGGVSGASQAELRIATGISSPFFHSSGSGDLLAVTEQPCDPRLATAAQAGVQFYDVSDPTSPRLLGSWSSGLEGVGDVALLPEPSQQKIYALVAVPGSETSAAGNGQGDLRVLDITDPTSPHQIGDWGVLKATDTLLVNAVMGLDPRVFLSTIELSSDGKTAYLGYWDEGVVVLDVSDPTQVQTNNPSIFLDHITYPITAEATTATPAMPEGNTREALPMANGTELLIADQVCASAMAANPANPASPTPLNPAVARVCGPPVPLSLTSGWGFVRTYSLTAGRAATLESFFATPQSMASPAPDSGMYTAHSLAWNGDATDPHAYVAWYSAGVQDLDVTSISPPTLLATFVPPDTPDPNGNNPAVNNPAKAMVAGVAAYNSNGVHYILASDINSGLWIVQEIPAPRLTLLTTSLPDGNVGVPYSAQLAAINGAAGSARMLFSLAPTSNPMPSGLILGSNGSITGTPLAAGSGTITFQVNDGAGHQAGQTVTMTVDQVLAVVPPTSIPLGTVGEGYSLQLAGINGTAPYTWSVARGSLPPGFSINATSGLISGTSTSSTAGTFTAGIQITDSAVPAVSASLPITIQIAGLTPQSTTLTDAVVNQEYTNVIDMRNGTGPFTLQLAAGNLPPGIAVTPSPSLNSAWLVTGTPTQAGTFPFSVLVTDTAGVQATVPLVLVVNALSIAPATLAAGVEGRGYQQSLAVAGGGASPQFSVVLGSLPAGLTLSRDGVLTGVPAAGSAGVHSFQVFAQLASGQNVSQNYDLTIFSPNALAITTVALPNGQAGQPYSQQISADFGTLPYSFQLLSGALPAGVTLDHSGMLQGVPGATSAGSYSFQVQVSDSTGATATRQLTWIISPPLPNGSN